MNNKIKKEELKNQDFQDYILLFKFYSLILRLLLKLIFGKI